jgi:hypothetical protein
MTEIHFDFTSSLDATRPCGRPIKRNRVANPICRCAFPAVLTLQLLLWGMPLRAQVSDGDAANVTTVDLPISASIVLPNSAGDRLVCHQFMNSRLETKAAIAVVDLESGLLIASKEFERDVRFDGRPGDALNMRAVGKDAVFVSRGNRTFALRLSDLSEIPFFELPTDTMHVVSDRYLVPEKATTLVDLKRRQASTRTRPQTLYRSDIFRSVFQTERGWHLDGMFYDADVGQPIWIAESPLRNDDQEHEPWDGRLEPALDGDARVINMVASVDAPLLAYLWAPAKFPEDGELPLTLSIAGFQATQPAASMSIGSIPESALLRNSNDGSWSSLRHSSSLSLDKIKKSGPRHPVVPLVLNGRRVTAVWNNRLWIWDLSDELFTDLPVPFRFRHEGLTVSADFSEPCLLEHALEGGTPPYTLTDATIELSGSVVQEFDGRRKRSVGEPISLPMGDDGRIDFTPATYLDDDYVLGYLKNFGIVHMEHVDRIQAQINPVAEHVLGRTLVGLPEYLRVTVRAVDSTEDGSQEATLVYHVLVEIPPERYLHHVQASEKEHVAAMEQREKEKQKRAERAREAQKAKDAATAARIAKDSSKSRAKPLGQTLRTPYGKLGSGLALVMLVAVAAWGMLVSLRGTMRRLRGPLIALCGALMFPLSVLIERIATSGGTVGSPRVQDFTIGFVIVSLFGLLFVGTFLTCLDKGRAIERAFVLSLFTPFGLMVAILDDDYIIEEPQRPKKKRKKTKSATASATGQRSKPRRRRPTQPE